MVATKINRPKQPAYKNFAKLARLKKQRKKYNWTKKEYQIPDGHLMPASHIKKHIRHPSNNMELSGKKKRKILNQIKRAQAKANRMDTSASGPSTSSSSTMKVVPEKEVLSSKTTEEDVEMEEAEPSTSQ